MPTPTQLSLQAQRIARQARLAAAAIGVRQTSELDVTHNGRRRRKSVTFMHPHRRPASDPRKEIALQCAEKHYAFFSAMMDGVRYEPESTARQEACYRMRYEMYMSYPKIGSFMGMDHKSVMYACARFKEKTCQSAS